MTIPDPDSPKDQTIMSIMPGTIVTYPEDLKWEPVGPVDENGKRDFRFAHLWRSTNEGPKPIF